MNKIKKSYPILPILGFIFILLKVTNQITWAWCYVLIPFWFPFALVFGFTFIIVAIMLIIATFVGISDWIQYH